MVVAPICNPTISVYKGFFCNTSGRWNREARRKEEVRRFIHSLNYLFSPTLFQMLFLELLIETNQRSLGLELEFLKGKSWISFHHSMYWIWLNMGVVGAQGQVLISVYSMLPVTTFETCPRCYLHSPRRILIVIVEELFLMLLVSHHSPHV